MNHSPTFVAFRWVVSLAWMFLLATVRAGEIPVASLFHNFEFEEMELSPDGKFLAMTGPQNGRRNLAVFDLDSRKPRWLTKLGDREVHDIRWFGDQIVFRLIQDGFDIGAICAIDRDGSDQRILIHSIERQKEGYVTYLENVELLSRIPGDDNAVLVVREEINQYTSARNRGTRHVHRLNLRNGVCAMEVKNPGDVIHWCADLKGQIRAALATDGDRNRLLYRAKADDPWATLEEWETLQRELFPVGFAADNRTLVVMARSNHDTSGLYLYDVDTKSLKTKIWHHDLVDADSVGIDPYSGAIVGLGYDDGRPGRVHFDPVLKAVQAGVDKALPDTSNLLTSYSRDKKRLLFLAHSDRDPGSYYLFDVDQKKLERLGSRTDRLRAEEMSAQAFTNYPARDGLRIPAYLTLPMGREPKNLPLVMMVHGGPWLRDYWGFDPEIQFFASRGYAVLQPNYRGSTGWGNKHFTAGARQWGLKMQDDVTDGVKWAVQQGIADPARVVIYGASYGGYASMMGLTATPELYRCGINYVGVTDIVRLLGYISSLFPQRYTAYRSTMIGDIEAERERLEATSPVNLVDRIRAPVFLAYGEKDSNVPIQQGRRLANELKRLDKPYEMIVKKDEGHGFFIEKNRIELFEAIDKFLKKHVP